MKGSVPVAANGAFFTRPTHVGQTAESVGRASAAKSKTCTNNRHRRVRQPFMFHYSGVVGCCDCRCRVPPLGSKCYFLWFSVVFLWPERPLTGAVLFSDVFCGLYGFFCGLGDRNRLLPSPYKYGAAVGDAER